MMSVKNFQSLRAVFAAIAVVSVLLFGARMTAAATVSHPPFRDTAYQAKYLSQSISDPVKISGGEIKEVVVKIKNVGAATWKKDGSNFVSIYTFDPKYRSSVFAGSGWIGKDQPAKLTKTTAPGETAEFKITLHAPQVSGEYAERFYLAAENKTWIKGGYFYFEITVVKPTLSVASSEEKPSAVAVYSVIPINTPAPPVAVAASSSPAAATSLDCSYEECSDPSAVRPVIPEPLIRVGLYKTTEEVRFQSEFPYQIYAGSELQGVLSPGTLAKLNYQNGIYTFKSIDVTFESSKYLRLAPEDQKHFFHLVNYERKFSGRGQMNYNLYRGTFEYKYSPKSAMPYIINELPLDLYARGITETSDGANVEFMKALSVAARSYAYSRIDTKTPVDKRTFDVYATTIDQLYLGYLSEIKMPRYARAAAETAGEMVTYKGNPIVTYYFSRSDGKTRDWKAKGSLPRPWLQSVETKYDKGMKMLGHGVGMSGHDASLRASKDGWTYKEILKYYYTGTEVEKIY